MTTRLCAYSKCRLPLVRREGEHSTKFAGRKCCNAEHGNLARTEAAWSRVPTAKVCRCGVEFGPREGEAVREWTERQACSDACGRANARETLLGNARRGRRRSVEVDETETRAAPGGDPQPVALAVHALRYLQPVWPERVSRRGSRMWIVGGLRLTTEQMLERAARA